MRILILSFYYNPDLSAGSFRTTSLVNQFKKIKKDSDAIDIISTMPNRYGSYNQKARPNESNDNIQIDRVDTGSHASGFIDQSLLFFKFAWEVFNILRKRKKYDLVYATSSRLMTAFLGALIARRQNAKLYLDIRDIFIDTLRSILKNRKLRYLIPIFSIIEKFTIQSATHINLVSKGFSTYFQRINNKVSYSFYSNGIDSIFLDYNFSKSSISSKKIITYAGNIGEGQGLEKIIPQIAIHLGSNYEFRVIGDGGTKRNLVSASQGIKNIVFYEPVDRNTLCKMYKDSDFLFLHLNSYEAFEKVLPSKIFEYSVTNKVIIAGVDGYASQFIKENVNNHILFKPCDIESFKFQFNNYDQSLSISRKKFIENFSRETIMSKLAKEVYSI